MTKSEKILNKCERILDNYGADYRGGYVTNINGTDYIVFKYYGGKNDTVDRNDDSWDDIYDLEGVADVGYGSGYGKQMKGTNYYDNSDCLIIELEDGLNESKTSSRKSIKESNKRKNLKESLSFKESELKVNVTFVYDEDNRSPSVSSEIATDYLYDLDDFKEVCDYLSESQNGYYSIEESRSTDGEYKIWFFTFDDSDDMDGTLTGYVIFNVVLNHNKEIEKFFDTI